MSGLLIDEPFVAVFPSLVRVLGSLETAVVLQVLHFHAEDSTVRISAQEVSDETGIAERTVRRRIAWLQEHRLISNEGRTDAFNPKRTFHINYDHPILSERGGHSDRTAGQNGHHSLYKNKEELLPSAEAEGWVEWWKRYPRKIDKSRAKEAYEKALSLTTADVLLAAITRQRPALMKRDTRYCPYPATWLNGCQWEDQDQEPEDDGPETMGDLVRRYHQ